MSTPDRRAMLDRNHPELSVRRQCALLSLARSGVYRPVPTEDEADLALMRRIDELFLAHPFLGSRRMAKMLSREGARVNRKRVQRLMRLMGIEALGPKPNTSKPAPGHTVYPYLLRGLTIERPNQVWAADITYIPIGRGFLYLVAVIDWASRAVLAWRLSTPWTCRSASRRWRRRGPGSAGRRSSIPIRAASSPAAAFTGVLASAGIRISMDGRGRWMDNVFIERLWRSMKHEDVYLKGYADGLEAKAGIAEWIGFYNTGRPHQALHNRTPMTVWRDGMTGALGERAVDMTLRLDNARALPTYPQPQQQQAA